MLMNAPLSNLYAVRELQLVLSHLKIECEDRILEIGCGNGLGSIIVSKISKEVVGLDISALVIKLLKDNYERHNLKFVCMDATRECPRSMLGYFSKVFCIDVMEHIEREKREKLLMFASDSLMRGGQLVFTFPVNNLNHGYLITKEDVYEFVTHLSESFARVDVKFLKNNLVGQIVDNFYGGIQKMLVPPKEGNFFEDSSCFQMLQNPKWYYKLIKLGTFLLFKLSAHSYKATEPIRCSRALIIGVDKK